MFSASMLASCNMTTPQSGIAGTYNTGIAYRKFDCKELAEEGDLISNREKMLVVAQNQRADSSDMQAFLWGVGAGDGLEAMELADVRGKITALRRLMVKKECTQPMPKRTPPTKPTSEADDF